MPHIFFAPLQAGKAVKMLSRLPVLGVLAGAVGTALKVGDGVVQTRRLEKVGVCHGYGIPAFSRMMRYIAMPCVPRLSWF